MTRLRKMMLEELQRRNYSQTTVKAYLHSVEAFAKHFHRSRDQLGSEQIRSYQVYLLEERKMDVRTVGLHHSRLAVLLLQNAEAKLSGRGGPRRDRDGCRSSSARKKRCDSSTPRAICFTAPC